MPYREGMPLPIIKAVKQTKRITGRQQEYKAWGCSKTGTHGLFYNTLKFSRSACLA